MSRFRIARCASGSCAAEGGPWHLIHPVGPAFGSVHPTWQAAVAAFVEHLDVIRRQQAFLDEADRYRASVRAGR